MLPVSYLIESTSTEEENCMKNTCVDV